MSAKISKKERREEREAARIKQVADDLQSALLSFRSKIHKMLSEPVGGSLAAFHPPRISPTSPGKKLTPFVQGEVVEPLEPIKLHKGTKLVLKDINREFKEPITSPKMQKNLRILELRLDAKGHLYSPKAFDPKWNWQTQAIWLRTIGLGYLEVSKRLGKSQDTVKSMFKRLGITKFFGRVSKLDYATIGYGSENSVSGERVIREGGASPIQHLPDEMVVNEETAMLEPLYKANFNIGSHTITSMSYEHKVSTKPFDLEKHRKEVTKRNKEEILDRKRIICEQVDTEIESLQRHIEEGFDPETCRYKKVIN